MNGKDSAWTRIMYQPSNLDIFKHSAKYYTSEKTAIPDFTYQSADNADLKALRTGFKLDSIAGTGNEVSKIINLLHWIHYLIPHDGKPLILNPDANGNRQTSTTKEDYLYNYMAKNLYRIECLVSSEYDSESPVTGKKLSYVELLPLDAYNQAPRKAEHPSTKSGVTFINYKTNNPDVFWAKPE